MWPGGRRKLDAPSGEMGHCAFYHLPSSHCSMIQTAHADWLGADEKLMMMSGLGQWWSAFAPLCPAAATLYTAALHYIHWPAETLMLDDIAQTI